MISSIAISYLEAEINRLRTTENASAHAIDRIRQHLMLDLVPGEHPSATASRIIAAIREQEALQ